MQRINGKKTDKTMTLDESRELEAFGVLLFKRLKQLGVKVQTSAKPKPIAKPATKQSAKTGKDYLSAFGPQGGVWFAEGKTFAEAQLLYIESLKAEAVELRQKLNRVDDVLSPFQAELSKMNKEQAKHAAKLGSNLGKFAAGIKVGK